MMILFNIILAGICAGYHWGVVAGIGVSATIYALAPYHPRSRS